MCIQEVCITKKGLEISTEHKRLLDSIDSSLMKDIPERDIRVARYVLEKMLEYSDDAGHYAEECKKIQLIF